MRGAIAFKEVLWGLSLLRGSLTQQGIHRAAMITLPPRMWVREGEDKAAVVEDIVNAVLEGRTPPELHDKTAVYGEGLLSPEEMKESLSKQKKTYLQDIKQPPNEKQSTVMGEKWETKFSSREIFQKNRKENRSFFPLKNGRDRSNSLKSEVTHSEKGLGRGRLLDMLNDGHRPGPRTPGKELVNTIMEFMEAQDAQWGNSVDFKQMYIYYHIKAKRGEEEVSPIKQDYHGLMMLIQGLEEEGILKANEKEHEFAISSEALHLLLKFFVEKDVIGDGFRDLTNFKRTLPQERRHELRKYTSGDVFRSISFRHTLREIVRRKKTLSGVARSDFRVFLMQPRKMECDTVLCVDTSASMALYHKLMYARLASVVLAKAAMNDGNRVSLVTFNNVGRTAATFSNKEAISDYILRLQARGNTNMEEGIRRASRLFFTIETVNRNTFSLLPTANLRHSQQQLMSG